MKLKLLMGAAIVSLSAGQAFAQSGPDTTSETVAEDRVVIIGEG
jgi:hypothetical protein